jgi:hypothetical protein
MKSTFSVVLCIALAHAPAYAISEKYRQQLERSGCTQMSESQGCDIFKTKAENARAGFNKDAPDSSGDVNKLSPYAGQWIAKSTSGATVATIRINQKDMVWVSGKKVKARRTDGVLLFRDGTITFTIQGDRRLQDQDYWTDSDAGTRGPIIVK